MLASVDKNCNSTGLRKIRQIDNSVLFILADNKYKIHLPGSFMPFDKNSIKAWVVSLNIMKW